MAEKLVYKLDGIDADAGVDVAEIAGVLVQFAQLVRAGNAELDLGLAVDVRVKPFRDGSWITEFVLHGTTMQDLLHYLKGTAGQDLKLLLEWLGIAHGIGTAAVGGVVGVATIIRFTKGAVDKFRANPDSTFTYENESGEKLTVTLPEHTLVQSPLVQNNYYNTFMAPLESFPEATGVEVGLVGQQPERFTPEDKPAFERYAKTDLSDATSENVSTADGIWLKPHRGSYAGEGTRYSFNMDGASLWPVTIADEEFLERLKTGHVRLHCEDSLLVELEISQRVNAHNIVTGSRYVITRVKQYVPHGKHDSFGL
jgi:hypothetical protein